MNPNIRATGMGMSSGRPPRSSGSEDSDEGGVVDGMMHRAITGNIDSEDGDDVGPARTKRRKNNNNNKKKAYQDDQECLTRCQTMMIPSQNNIRLGWRWRRRWTRSLNRYQWAH
jgi:hypothetical protein